MGVVETVSVSKFNKRFSKWRKVAAPKGDKDQLKETFIAHDIKETLRLLYLGGSFRNRANARRRARTLKTKMRQVGPKIPHTERRKIH